MGDKFILDACCGGRMFWFNKNHPNTIFQDNRIINIGDNKYRPNHTVIPDINGDFRKMAFKDNSFKLVVFDPPHLKQRVDATNSAMLYGVLNAETWREDIKKGFDECWRVLEDYGILVFKWNESSIKISEILKIVEREPLFGNRQGTKLNTHWFVFMKIPECLEHKENAPNQSQQTKPNDTSLTAKDGDRVLDKTADNIHTEIEDAYFNDVKDGRKVTE